MSKRILLTGATGYVGGRLLSAFEERGRSVHCLVRRPEHLADRVAPTTCVIKGDVLDRESLRDAFAGVDVAYYLIHAMGSASEFEEKEAAGARNFAAVARESGLERIVYLGGLGDEGEDLSPHLSSRHAVGRILRESGVPTIELRASIILGSGSLSYEMIRALTEHLPVMITPKWVSVQAQPIAIRDVLAYLIQALDVPLDESTVFEIGGADRLSYRDLMKEYAEQRGLKRLMIPVPVLSPRLSSLWLGLVTPLYARVGRKLVESIRHPTVVRDERAREVFDVEPCGAAEAIRRAIAREQQKLLESAWSDSMAAAGSAFTTVAVDVGNRLIDHREREVDASAEACFRVVESLGGENGWPPYTLLWRVRGAMDLLVGGVGMRRGRPKHRELRAGDPLDFWRVVAFDCPERLLLRAEMKVPGRAWLEYRIERDGEGSVLHQTATFDPRGLFGLLYWYGIYPVHALVFRGTIRHLARLAEALKEDGTHAIPSS